MATAVKRAPAAATGGLFRILIGEHLDQGPPGCECRDCLDSGGKNHRYRAKRTDSLGGHKPDPDDYDGDLIESKVDLDKRFNHGPGSRKFERVGDEPRGPQYVPPPEPFPLERMTLAQLMAVAVDEEIDLEGATKKDDVLRRIRVAQAGGPHAADQ